VWRRSWYIFSGCGLNSIRKIGSTCVNCFCRWEVTDLQCGVQVNSAEEHRKMIRAEAVKDLRNQAEGGTSGAKSRTLGRRPAAEGWCVGSFGK